MPDPTIADLLQRGGAFTRAELLRLLQVEGDERKQLMARAAAVRRESVGDKVYFRGLIEYSNRCRKNCLYCGVRSGNAAVSRYQLTEAEVLSAADFAWRQRYGSIVIQGGERQDEEFVAEISALLVKLHAATNHELRVTLSFGEQAPATYRQWYAAGATRYLLRIETASPDLYRQLHPDDGRHRFADRCAALAELRGLLQRRLREMPDTGFVPEPVFAAESRGDGAAFGQANRARLSRLLEIADLQLLPVEQARPGLERALASEQPLERYWALIGCSAFGERAAGFAEAARACAARDADRLVRARAAEFLGLIGAADPRPSFVEVLNATTDPIEAGLVFNSVALLKDARGLAFPLDAVRQAPWFADPKVCRERRAYLAE